MVSHSRRALLIAIRKVEQSSDLEQLLEVVRSYSPGEAEWLELRDSLEREFDERHGNREIYIASDGVEPVGICQLILHDADDDPDLADGSNVAHVHHLRVLHGRRREGLGRQLMLHAEKQARALGRQRLTVGVDSWNDAAIALYAALGYTPLKEADGPTPDQKVFYLEKAL